MSNNLLRAKLTIVGTRPLLWHAFGPDAIPLEKQERTGVAGNDPQEWHKTVLMTPDRQLYLDSSYGFAAIRDGAKYTKRGHGSIQGLVAATLQVTDELLLVDRWVPADGPIPDRSLPVYLDVRGVRNPSTKGRNVRYRVAASTGWKLSMSLLWDKTVINRNELEAAITDAGRLSGLGDGRTIGFGRFDPISFEVAAL